MARNTVLSTACVLLCGAPVTWAQDLSNNEGFWAGSSLTGSTKNYYFNRDFRNGGSNGRTSSPNGYRGEWAQGLILDFKSGYTPGTVGFGADAYGYAGLKLDSGRGKTGTLLLPIDNSGTPQDQYSVAGGAVKMRIGDTVLKYGNMEFRSAPIFFQDGGNGRLLPQTATGWQIISKDLKPLTLEAAHITAAKSGAQNSNAGVILSQYGGVETPTVDYAGGTYQEGGLTAALYSLDAENLWRQHYVNLKYSAPLTQHLRNGLNFTLYRTTDTGSAKGGEIDNTSWSLANALTFGSHTVTLSYQQVDGDQPFDYLGYEGKLSTVPFLANISTIHDFNAPHERSWGLRYDLEMAGYGIPGLSFMARYIVGREGDGSDLPASSSYANVGFKDNERHWERDLDMRYIVQSGSAKGLSFRLVYATTRANSNEPRGDMDEVRVITQFPFKIF
jgi:imipenem/basic amino acid-specific outer membrane pore